MKKVAAAVALLLVARTAPVAAQNWSLGAGTGPFVFGHFAERTLRASTEQPSTSTSSVRLSAATRPGLSVDLERSLSDRFAVRFEGTFTDAPFEVRDESGTGVSLGAGRLDVGTFTMPVVLRLNPRGALRFHLMAGPAYALYHVGRTPNAALSIPPFTGTRARWGAAGGGGAAWWLSNGFAVEGQLTDIRTTSPFRRDEFAASSRIKILRPHNVHTTVGVRVRF